MKHCSPKFVTNLTIKNGMQKNQLRKWEKALDAAGMLHPDYGRGRSRQAKRERRHLKKRRIGLVGRRRFCSDEVYMQLYTEFTACFDRGEGTTIKKLAIKLLQIGFPNVEHPTVGAAYPTRLDVGGIRGHNDSSLNTCCSKYCV